MFNTTYFLGEVCDMSINVKCSVIEVEVDLGSSLNTRALQLEERK
jgi:hypothetical protein